jgi:hypothetical protein
VLAEGLKGTGPGQKGVVDGLALGMATGFTFHGWFPGSGFWFKAVSFQPSAVSEVS